ncbi:hypothetical protein KAR34_01220 [bacterium]|nr:hypothetical protein [bacterium]
MTIPTFILQFILAWIAIAAVIYLPGRLLVRVLRLELDQLEHMVASLMGGTGLFVLLYYVFAALQQRWLIWPVVLLGIAWEIFFAICDWKKSKDFIPDPGVPPPVLLKSFWPLGLLMLAGLLVQGRYTLFTGWLGETGFSLLAWHAHDAPWHIYNIAQLAGVFPPEMPGFAGKILQNYHIFSDLLWSGLLQFVPIHPWHCYFRVAPLFYSGLLTLTTFVAARYWSGKNMVGYIAVAITVLLSNFGYFIPLFWGVEKYPIWESIFWIQSPQALIFNPGVSSSFSFLLFGFWALLQWLRSSGKWGFLILLALLWGVLPGFKVYPAVLAMCGLLVTGAVLAMAQRNYRMLIALGAILPLFLLVFLPGNSGASSLLRFLPGFNLGAMLVAPDRLAWMTSAELKLLYVSKPWLVALIMAGLAGLFLLGNLGVRALGLIPMLRSLLNLRTTEPGILFITVVVGGAFMAPLLFVQHGIPWNVVQFFYYAVLLSALPAADQFWKWIEHKKVWLKYSALALLLILGIPGTIQSLLAINWSYKTKAEVMRGLEWLQKNTNPQDVILRPLPDALMTEAGYKEWKRSQVRGRMTNMDAWQKEAKGMAKAAQEDTNGTTTNAATGQKTALPTEEQLVAVTSLAAVAGNTETVAAGQTKIPDPDLERTDTAIVAGLVLRNTYMEDTVSSQIMNFPVETRLKAVRYFYSVSDVVEARVFLEKEKIAYVILFAGQNLPFDPAGVPLKNVFENKSITVYKYIFPGGW